MVVVIVILLVIIVALLGGGPVLGVLLAIAAFTVMALMVGSAFRSNPEFMWTGLAVSVALIGGLLTWWIRKDKKAAQEAEKFKIEDGYRLRGLRRIGESKEVETGILQHPDGPFIAKGPRGGYCAFNTLGLARIYRDKGPAGVKAHLG